MTRAELAIVLDRIMQYQGTCEMSFIDVGLSEWYYDSVCNLANAGIIIGIGENYFAPDNNLTREEAVVMIARAFRVMEIAGETTFRDDNDISEWAKPLVNGMSDAQFIYASGNRDFFPQNTITRAEVVTMLDSVVELICSVPGRYGGTDNGQPDGIPYFTNGNIVVNTGNVRIRDMMIRGDLFINNGTHIDTVTLNRVRVTGRAYISGGAGSGTTDGDIIATDCIFDDIYIESQTNPTIVLSDNTRVSRIFLSSDCTIIYDDYTITYDLASRTITLTDATEHGDIITTYSLVISFEDFFCEIISLGE